MADEASRDASKELVKLTRPFAEENLATTWILFGITVAAFATTHVTIALAPWPLKFLLSAIAGLLIVRMFIFFHDHVHKAIWRKDKIGHAVMTVFGVLILTPRPVWQETHDYHHQNNAKLIGSSVGSYPVVTTRMWRVLKPAQRRKYKIARHPLTIIFGYFTVFGIGMCISPFIRNPKMHWQSPFSLVLHIAIIAALWMGFGASVPFFHIILPMFIGMGSGSYLFYAQHNFPDIKLKDRREWDYFYAALNSSSMFDMNPVMHWFTGNIGYHHIHHLNHKIPFYRLPEAMAAMPELQSPYRTTWRPSDVWACLRLKVWDAKQGRLITWAELEEARQPEAAAAK